jgi:hypothetical protein
MASKEDDLLPQDNSEYATKKYWDQRYEKYDKSSRTFPPPERKELREHTTYLVVVN